MKNIIFILTIFLTLNTLAKSKIEADTLRPIKSDEIKNLIMEVVDSEMYWADEKYSEKLGSMWVNTDIDDATMSIVGPITKDSETGALVMNTFNEIGCGSEYDESEFYGSCEVKLIKIEKWEVSDVKNCNCDPGY